MFDEKQPQSQGKEVLSIDDLPLPPTVEEILASDPEASPIQEEDFERLEAFFDEQVVYFTELSKKYAANGEDEDAEAIQAWADRVPELFEEIRAGTRLITEDLFYEALEPLRGAVEDFVGADPYVVFLHGDDLADAQHHSTFFVAQEMGLPEDQYITQDDLGRQDIQDFINQGGKIVIVDDAAYSGLNLDRHLRHIRGMCPSFDYEQVHVSLIGTTAYALKKLQESGVSVSAEYQIEPIEDVFSGDSDLRILRFMKREMDDGNKLQIPVHIGQVATLFWQKVPDNFCHALRKWYNKYWNGEQFQYFDGYLVDDSPGGIYPDYRAGKTYSYS